ncbi:MAG: hypothetical protein Q7R76_04195 [Candidatus Woesearchaeota archaeon]|nr:hypothetical protein [Candidatus Woesearchaeota archaeon]
MIDDKVKQVHAELAAREKRNSLFVVVAILAIFAGSFFVLKDFGIVGHAISVADNLKCAAGVAGVTGVIPVSVGGFTVGEENSVPKQTTCSSSADAVSLLGQPLNLLLLGDSCASQNNQVQSTIKGKTTTFSRSCVDDNFVVVAESQRVAFGTCEGNNVRLVTQDCACANGVCGQAAEQPVPAPAQLKPNGGPCGRDVHCSSGFCNPHLGESGICSDRPAPPPPPPAAVVQAAGASPLVSPASPVVAGKNALVAGGTGVDIAQGANALVQPIINVGGASGAAAPVVGSPLIARSPAPVQNSPALSPPVPAQQQLVSNLPRPAPAPAPAVALVPSIPVPARAPVVPSPQPAPVVAPVPAQPARDACDSNLACPRSLPIKVCRKTVLGQPKACLEQAIKDAYCETNTDCMSQNCVAKKCALPVQQAQPAAVTCRADAECPATKYCELLLTATCINKRADGAVCNQNKFCLSNNCVATKCAAPLPVVLASNLALGSGASSAVVVQEITFAPVFSDVQGDLTFILKTNGIKDKNNADFKAGKFRSYLIGLNIGNAPSYWYRLNDGVTAENQDTTIAVAVPKSKFTSGRTAAFYILTGKTPDAGVPFAQMHDVFTVKELSIKGATLDPISPSRARAHDLSQQLQDPLAFNAEKMVKDTIKEVITSGGARAGTP